MEWANLGLAVVNLAVLLWIAFRLGGITKVVNYHEKRLEETEKSLGYHGKRLGEVEKSLEALKRECPLLKK